MKRIGILHGKENTFPQAFVDRVNLKSGSECKAEIALVEEVFQARANTYAVLIDRISQDVPFYRAMLKNAAITGTAVVNNPFWWSADEKFFNNALAETIGVPVPKTFLLPSKERPDDTNEDSFRNLKFPLEWERMVEELGGFPLYMKPHEGGGWKSVYKIRSMEELWQAYHETGRLVMMLQETVKFEQYFRCYYIGGRVRIMPYEPRNPHHLRYVTGNVQVDDELLATMQKYIVAINEALGYDFNTVEFAIRDGIPLAIDFCNPAPDADIHSVGEENFEWVVEQSAEFAIERALSHEDGKMHLTWGHFITQAVKGELPG